jgi:phospholipid/cholesterol/gamma-HCH transport system ATP-binding protein
MSEAIISIRDLTVSYGGRRVLDGVNLDIQRGEVIALLGASGSGKSTMLRHIIGLAKPDSGTIHIQGVDINRCSARELMALRRDLGVAFQGSALFSSMSVEENIRLPLRELTSLSDPVIEIMTYIKLASVGLGEAGKLMPQELSGGMKKRAAVARATALDPEILIFDEPSAGLDPIVAAELDELILFLKRAFHMTVVIVTHEMASAFRVADRLAMLYMGSLIAVENKESFSASTDPRIRQFLDRKPQHIAESESVQRRLRALVSMTGATE